MRAPPELSLVGGAGREHPLTSLQVGEDYPRDPGRSFGNPARNSGERGEEFVSQNIMSGNYKGALLDICSKMKINPATFDVS